MEEKTETKFQWPLIGNKKNTDFLSKILLSGKMSGSYIFSGPDNMGKTKLAEYFSQLVLCEQKNAYKSEPCGVCPSCRKFKLAGDSEETIPAHNDFHIIKKDKDKKNISIEQIRGLIHFLGMSSFSDSYKIGIIKHADKLSDEAANALLKILEEPKKKTIIILIASNPDKILKTIISRSFVLDFVPLSTDAIYDYLLEKYDLTRSAAKNYSRLCLGRPALAVKFVEDREFYESYLERLDVLLGLAENDDLNFKFASIESLFDKKMSGQEQSAVLARFLEVLQGLCRDIYLQKLGLNDLVQNEVVNDRLRGLSAKKNIQNSLEALDEMDRARDYLEVNINPKLILENISLSL